MKTSQLIMLLEKCQKAYGDLPVYFTQEWEEPVENVRYFNVMAWGSIVDNRPERIELSNYSVPDDMDEVKL